MKVSTLRSVGAKLFYYMSLLVLITVAGNSFQYVRTFMAYQTEQVRDSIQLNAEHSANQIKNVIEGWTAQVNVALPTLRGADQKATNAAMQAFVDSNGDFIHMQLLGAATPKAKAFSPLGEVTTSATADTRFTDGRNDDVEVPKLVAKLKGVARKWLATRAPKLKKEQKVIIESVAKSTGLPIMLVAARFEVQGTQQVVWAVLAVWQTKLMKALPKSDFVEGVLVDKKGKVMASAGNLDDMTKRRKFGGAPLVKQALEGKTPSGFTEEYKDQKGHLRIGAFSRMPTYDAAVLIQQDAEVAYRTLKKNLLSTALWAGLFILIAVMFSFLGAAGITKGLRAVANATSRIASGDFKTQIQPSTRDEVGMLAVSVNNMSRKIVELLQSQVEKARFEKELETAKMVQSTFFPKAEIKRPNVFVTGFYQPASECGGDLWGHFDIDDGVSFVFIADAMGHGAPAALVTAMAYSTTMTVADIIKDKNGFRDSPAVLLDRLNRIIYEAVRGTISITFFGCVVDTKRGTLTYANAGHNFPLVVPMNAKDPRSGKGKPVSKNSDINPISLKLMGTPLGMDPNTKFKEATLELKAGDKLFFFTDGLIECKSPKGEAWGRKYLLEQIAETAKMGAEEMKDEVLGRAFTFFGNKPLDDDVTVVVAEIPKDWAPSKEPLPMPEAVTVEAVASDYVPSHAAPAKAAKAELPQMPPVTKAAAAPQSAPPTPTAARAPTPGTGAAVPAAVPNSPGISTPTEAKKGTEAAVPVGQPRAQAPQPAPQRATAPAPRTLEDPVTVQPEPLGRASEPTISLDDPAPQPAPVAQKPAPQPSAPKSGKYKLKLPTAG